MRKSALTFMLLILFCSLALSQDFTNNQYKEDYLEACELIAKKYIYFERKLPFSRAEFLKQKKQFAEGVNWNKKLFVKEMRKLRALFPDGHFYWEIPRTISPIDGFYTLGFVSTFTVDSALVVKKVFPYFNHYLMVNDTIIEINGLKTKKFIKEYGKREPQSTLAATYEIAARNLSLIKYNSPSIDTLDNIELKVLRNHQLKTFNLEYKKCSITTNISKSRTDSSILLLQRNGYLSLEEIPKKFLFPHPSLLLYTIEINKLKYCILHPRDFVAWKATDIDTVMGIINSMRPDVLVIDLKDCSGGGFNDMLYLSYAVNVKKEFYFFYDIIDKESRRISGVYNFNFITNRISLKNTWKGKLLIRSNEICGSACDFFIRWMKMNNRAEIIGMPPAGRGGGTDSFVLKNTKTKISFPLRERIPLSYMSSIESESMEIDYYSEKNILSILEELAMTDSSDEKQK